MFPTAVIVFREILEIAIVLTVILVATRGLPQRTLWAWVGIGLGVAGSVAVAYFINEISALAEGMGQEIFNACVLFAAAAVIGWTVLWMRTHAKTMVEKIKNIGKKVSEGEIHLFSISIVIGLAFLREGSEIVLFSNGILLSGQVSLIQLLAGAGIGLLGGSVVGYLMYLGFIRISTKYIFQVTSWLLIFLAAGMASTGAGYLVQAGVFEQFTTPVWDTSFIIPDGSVIGTILSALIGYTATPMGIQLVFYVLTLGVLSMSVIIIEKSFAKKTVKKAALATAVLLLGTSNSFALDSVRSPYVEKGEFEIETKGYYKSDSNDAKDNGKTNELEIGYSFTDYWATSVAIEGERESGQDHDYLGKALEWENKFQLTEAGEYWADFGIYGKYEHALHKDESNEIKVMALVAKDFGKFSNILNIGFEREVGEEESGGNEGIITWSTRYRYMEEFEPGFEIQSNFGKITDPEKYEDQKHQIGPVAYGHLPFGVGYELGYLFGASKAAPDGELKAVLEYEFHF